MYANQGDIDLDRINDSIDFWGNKNSLLDCESQNICLATDSLSLVANYLYTQNSKRPFLVCGKTAKSFLGWKKLCGQFPDAIIFSRYSSNPDYESALAGAKEFSAHDCDAIVAVGGGSALDMAKAVKLFSAMDLSKNCMDQITCRPVTVPFLAIPTTAGTGSESTHFAVIYYQGKKQSLEHQGLLPDSVILDSIWLSKLPTYQKYCTFMDALTQCIESVWARAAVPQSQQYACMGIQLLVQNFEEYMQGEPVAARKVLLGANFSGRAIDLSKTTAAHALSYGLTSCLHIPHGHAVALALPPVWRRLLQWQNQRRDPQIEAAFDQIDKAFGFPNHGDALAHYCRLCDQMYLEPPQASQGALQMLSGLVNTQRLDNFPMALSAEDINDIYCEILF